MLIQCNRLLSKSKESFKVTGDKIKKDCSAAGWWTSETTSNE